MGLTLIDRASMIAAEAHRNQVRKYGGVPYINHPTAVACEIAQAGYSEDCIAAAFLHDVVEDTDMTFPRLEAELGVGGERTIDLVRLATEPGKEHGIRKPWAQRKEHLVTIAAGRDIEVAALIVTDKHHNLRALMYEVETMGPSVWKKMNAGPEQRSRQDVCDPADSSHRAM